MMIWELIICTGLIKLGMVPIFVFVTSPLASCGWQIQNCVGKRKILVRSSTIPIQLYQKILLASRVAPSSDF